jgi:putative transposase
MATDDAFKTSLHTPAHLLRAGAYYLLTGATYHHQQHLSTAARKSAWLNAFTFASSRYGWTTKAWVVLSNHYHVLVQAPADGAENLAKFVASYHKFTAARWNEQDRQAGRKVWWNYWDTCLATEVAFRSRWNYVHWNPVKHGLVVRPDDYEFSSYRQFYTAAPEAVRGFEQRYAWDQISDIPDDFGA